MEEDMVIANVKLKQTYKALDGLTSCFYERTARRRSSSALSSRHLQQKPLICQHRERPPPSSEDQANYYQGTPLRHQNPGIADHTEALESPWIQNCRCSMLISLTRKRFSPKSLECTTRTLFYGAIRFSVTSEDGRPRLIRNVTCHNIIKASDIKEAHFAGHNCQDQVQSCFHQVRAAVPQVKGCRNVCIVCNGLSLTYGENTTDGCYTLKTRCRLVFKHRITLRELLEMKCWLEQEKPHKKGLLACFDRLLNQVTELPYVPNQCTFILQSDGEMVELLESSGKTGREFFIFGGANGVSVYPPQWE
ncbi:hypothetical protein AAFF_G00254140 [Aldrovandia affinis]|uniref:Uncharacterized protein n=1 Tax=Aldrovandia affinis TaxID=143900 RepID=A0AAD7RCV9_9TELE|nr:hypothetical protein AAFF_G00254140 [Aldrovandia affinis]